MTTRKLSIEVVGDVRNVTKAFGDVDAAAGKMESGVVGKVGGAGRAVAGASVAVAGAAGAFVLGAVKVNELGLKMESMGIKASTVFGDSLGKVEAWAAANAKAMGLTGREATGLAANMGDLLKPMGFTADQAADMSTEMVGLSGALAAWSDGTVDAAGASDIMTKAMLGETDGLKALGISISAAEVSARLAANGQDQLTGAALAQAEALAVQQLIMEKSTDAQTAWTNGSMDSVKASNAQKAGLNELKATLVTALYPAVQALIPILGVAVEWLGTNLPVAMAVVKDWVDENWPAIRDTITGALEFVSDYVSGFVETVQSLWAQFGDRIMTVAKLAFEFVQTTVDSVMQVVRGIIDVVMGVIRGDWGQAWDGIKQILSGVFDAMVGVVKFALGLIGGAIDTAWENVKGATSSAWNVVKSAVSGAIDNVVGYVTGIPSRISATVAGLWDGIKSGITAASDWVSDKIDDVVGFAKGLPGKLTGVFVGMWDGIKTAFKSAINSVIDAWNGLSFTLPSTSVFGQKIGGGSISTPNVPRIHTGGVVGGQMFGGMGNDEVAAILQKGEVVLTAGQVASLGSGNAGGGVNYTIIVQADATTDRVALGRAVTEAITEFELVNGARWRASV